MDTDMVTAMLVTDTDIILVMDMVMVTVMVTAMDTDIIYERGPLMPSPLLMPNPLLPLSPDMLMAVMVVLMDTDTPMLMLDTITAKDLLNPLLSPPLLLNLDTVTVMLTVTDTDTDTDMLDTITAKGLLKPSLLTVTVMLLLMPTMVTVMVVATVMVMVTVMASKFILLSFLLSNYYNGCVYKKFYDSENFDLRSRVPEVESLAY